MNLTRSAGNSGECHTDPVGCEEQAVIPTVAPRKADGVSEARYCGWCGESEAGVNHVFCASPLQDIADNLDERAASVEERAEIARAAAGRILRVVA